MKLLIRYTLILLATSAFLSAVEIEEVGITLGITSTPYTKTNKSGTLTLIDKPNNSFTTLALYTILSDKTINKNITTDIELNFAKNSKLKQQSLLVGLNYNHYIDSYILQGGILLGYTQLKWDYDPLQRSKEIDKSTDSFTTGINLGIKYNINKSYILNLKTRYMIHSLKTELKPDDTLSSTIEHKDTTSFLVGVGYKF